jgi:hypothetical protein
MSGRNRDVVWEHGGNLAPGWRCNYYHVTKAGGGCTRFKHHLARHGADTLHCDRVPPDVRAYFRRDLDRAKKTTADRARQRLAREKLQQKETIPSVMMNMRLR